MARVLATVGGVAITPGVSRNRRLYTREMLAKAVAKMQDRIAGGETVTVRRDGTHPLTNLTHHDAADDSTRIVGRVTSVTLGGQGEIRYTADIPDTAAGRDIAALVDTSDGKPPFLRGVSIRGMWEGTVRKVTGPDGKPAETADGLDLAGWDYTATPGVPSAGIDTFSWATGEQNETHEQVLITESVQEAQVTFTETADTAGAPAPPEGLTEALSVILAVAEEATPAIPARGSGLTGGGRVWADPGYQADHKQRYDITTKALARTAWSYIHQDSKAAKYSGAQLKQIKSRIRAALKKFGVTAATEGWTVEPVYQVTENVAEYLGMDSAQAGSWCITASNGPVRLSLSSYCMDPADLRVILAAAAVAAGQTLAALDPDMDGDVDVPGVGDTSDPDDDAGAPGTGDSTESVTGSELTGDIDPGQPATERETEKRTEAPAMAEATTTQGGSVPAPALTPELLAAIGEAAGTAASNAATAALEKFEADKAARKAAKKTSEPADESAPAPAVPVAETDERIAALVAEKLKEAGITPPAPLTEEQRIDQLVTERIQAMVGDGRIPVGRQGITVIGEHAVPTGEGAMNASGLPAEWPDKPISKFAEDEFNDAGGAALDVYVFGNRGKSLH